MTIFTLHIGWFVLAPTWYGLMYTVSFLIGLFLMSREFKAKDTDIVFIATVLGVIIWGRLGYVFFYNFGYFLDNPAEIFMPWKGGMSFHGGAIGVIIAWYFAAQKIKQPFLSVADKLVWIIPVGLFFGRIGNFINGELLWMAGYSGVFARTVDWISYFPTPLLEALLEGLTLFLILWWKKKHISYPWQLGVWFLFFYGVFRFIAEFFRNPDPQIGYIFEEWMTLGHLFSIIMIFVAIALSQAFKRR